ncbi:uncharacterized protein MYCFIDRAFT_179247 [Pseudocercospora fijiensis CIRAD86]|uniref:Uncharacterized protein n=1 Tax=Pseudocercospora fijiensis (strain CIRAD86) TaxID=383855 RepID=M2ZF79_PSEFD|nr:uncharacterized protein MYCFIDRAFT_179247 [Pseudocercospora fijiensis CIRAD86]EME77754.1 hypothetical protein MYCFIDRAFT_179247 [Pseudocercospora fijiensis CIRAD86]
MHITVLLGVSSRNGFSACADLRSGRSRTEITKQPEKEVERGNAYHQDTSLHNHIYTRRPRSTHFFIGTVQNQEAQKRDIQLLETADKAKPIERKNVILARFEETNGFRMLGTFRMLNTWRFVTADGKSYFTRIGDVEGGIACDLAFLERNKVKLSKGYQENGSNVDLGELRRRVGKRLGELRKDKKKWDGAEREVPKLPPLTLQHFPAAQLHDASNVLKDGVKGLAVVRVVYMLPAAALADHAKRSPQNCYFDIDKTTTFADMDAVLLSGNAPSHQRIERGVRHIRPTRVWWIMDPRMEGDIGKMYRVNKMSTQVCRYIKDAPSSDGFTLYTECHIREANAKHEYDEDGKTT